MSTLQEKINALPIEERAWLLGTKSENPLGCAFAKKRVVHPGAGGKRMVMDKGEQTRIWADLMAQTPNPADERAVYIHIPFCDKKCSYCGFFQNFTREEAAHHYVEVLLDELDAAADTPYVQGAPFQAVFFGGGTPTALSDADIAHLVQAVRARLPLTSDCEITLEGRIHDLTESKVEAAMNAGINRFSLGVQSFDTRVRQAIGRIDDSETVIATLRRMVEQQGAVVIADLIYGLPYQSMEVWENDVRTQFEIGIAGGEVVIYRYHMHAFAGERVQIYSQRGHQGFTLTGAHFGDFALVQHHPTDELHIKMAHAQCAAGGFAAHGKGFFQNVVQGFALGEPLLEFYCFGLQRRIVELLDIFFHAVDAYHGFAVLFQKPVVAAAEHFFGQ